MMRVFTRRKLQVFLLVIFSVIYGTECDLRVSVKDVEILLHKNYTFQLQVRNLTEPDAELTFLVQHDDIIEVQPKIVNLEVGTYNVDINIEAIGAGHSLITANSSTINVDNVYLRVKVNRNDALDTVSIVIGWIYFVAWSVSFYPQIYENYQRQSVIGLNFDFLALNIVGFTLYAIFNLGLYYSKEIQAEYFSRYPRGVNPVQVNDIVFAVHATIATIFTIIQCFIYQRGDQRVSITARSILGVFFTFLLITVILAAAETVAWLDFINYCSYIKLTITLIKYIPQAYMNYKRKCTVGWSIGNIFLDFTGGTLSMLQMMLIAYNYDDWVSIFGDPTKFGLGLFSVCFDILFLIQHYVLYKDAIELD